jgi:hypothetical protein
MQSSTNRLPIQKEPQVIKASLAVVEVATAVTAVLSTNQRADGSIRML